jgi:hypothetical protein
MRVGMPDFRFNFFLFVYQYCAETSFLLAACTFHASDPCQNWQEVFYMKSWMG